MSRKGYGRAKGTRRPRQAIAVFAEGEVTEAEYLASLLSELGIPKELVRIEPSAHTDPKGLVDEAVEAKRRNERDSRKRGAPLVEHWWVLADTELGRPGLADAVQKAKANGIWLGLCDPSVEFWLLLHFRFTTRCYGGVRELVRELGEHMPSYDEGNKHPDMGLLMPRLPVAMDNASRLRRVHTDAGIGSPRADFDILVSQINCQAPEGRELVPRREPAMEELSMFKCPL